MKNKWLDEETIVSDDPRRIPILPMPKGPEQPRVLRGGRIFAGTGKPIYDGTIVLERNKIKDILPPNSKDWPEDAKVIELEGKTVMPGLIDMHTHLTYNEMGMDASTSLSEADQTLRGVERLRYYIESGITTVRDMASHGNVIFRLKEWIAQNRIPGSRIFAVGQFITGTGGHAAENLDEHSPMYGDILEASGPDQWRDAVRKQYKMGADLIKTGSHFSVDEINAAVEEAHSLGLKVSCDAERFYIQRAVEAGVDIIEHPLPRTDETIALMAERGTESIPTMIPYDVIIDTMGGYFGSTSRKFTLTKEKYMNLVKKMKDAGIKMGIGTDVIFHLFRYLPGVYLAEMKNFSKLGYSNEDVLITATRVNAEILDMDDKLGTLEAGKLADIIVVDGKPDKDLADLKKVDLAIRDGYIQVENGRLCIDPHPELPVPDGIKEKW